MLRVSKADLQQISTLKRSLQRLMRQPPAHAVQISFIVIGCSTHFGVVGCRVFFPWVSPTPARMNPFGRGYYCLSPSGLPTNLLLILITSLFTNPESLPGKQTGVECE